MWDHHEQVKGDPVWADAVAEARSAGRHALADRLLDPSEYPDQPGIANAWSRSAQWNLERTDRENYGQRVDVRHDVRISMVGGTLEAIEERERLMIEKRKREAIPAEAHRIPLPASEDEEPDDE